MKKFLTLLALFVSTLALSDTPPIIDIFKLKGEGKTGAVTVQGGVVTNVVPGASGNTLQSDGTDWVSGPGAGSISVSAPITYESEVIGCQTADAFQAGCLSASDWSSFNNKLDKSEGNFITNPNAEVDTSGWNLYNDTGRTVPASVVKQDITYTSALSGNAGNGATITYGFCGSSFGAPVVTCPSGSSVNVCWYNGPTLADNQTATQIKTAFDATPCAVAIATDVITGSDSKLQYEDGASTLVNGGDQSPVDGTGGTATGLTFTRNTSTPLVGTASFDLGKSSGSAMGQGVSTDFVIDALDKGQTLQVSFAYSGSSGMTLGSSSDVQVFIYDIDTPTLIPVTPAQTIAGPVSTAKVFTGVFTATQSSNYRLILHTATANSSAWDLILDDFIVTDDVTAAATVAVPSVVLVDQPISGTVTDHMVVMWTDGAQHWVPATIAGAALPVFGDDKTQLGFATNIVGSTASVYTHGYMGGFSFGPFVGYEQYVDNTAGGISPLPAPFTDMYVMVGMAISATELNIQFDSHVDQISNGSGVPVKGGLLTVGSVNDGTGDVVLSPGANGTLLVANSAVAKGLNWRTLLSADVPTLNQNTTGSAATLTTARTIAGTSFNGSANIALANKFIVQGTADTGLSGAQFLGALATGLLKNTTTTGVLSAAAASDVTGQLLTGYTSGAGTVAATDSVLTAIEKLNGNDVLKANIASPTFTGTVALASSTLANGASAATNAVIVYKDGHLKSTMTTPPTAVVAAGAGTGASCTLAHASDSAGVVTLTTGSVGTPATGTQCTVTFNKAYATIPVCVFSPGNTNAGSNLVLFSVASSTTTTQPFVFGVAGGTSTPYIYNYHCTETQ